MKKADRTWLSHDLQANERFREVADFLRDVLLLSNADFSEILFVNRAYETVWGRTVESLYLDPGSLLEGFHPGDRKRVEAAVQRVVNGEPLDNLECRVVRPDGSISWVRLRAQPVRDSRGHPYRLVGSVHEFTKRKQAEDELRRLSGKILQLQDEERRAIARDLHDSTGQDLVTLDTMLSQLRGAISSNERKPRKLLAECRALAARCLRDVRTLSYALFPSALEDAGLEDAIRDYVKGFTKRTGIQVELEFSLRIGRMETEIELALFRVVQESLTNILRHSGSQHAKVRIHRNSDLTLEISDLGPGVPANKPRRNEGSRFEVGVGIPSMQERVRLVGGRLDIDSNGHRTTVRVTIPLRGEPT
jgi:two-component system NarL family sensor kinase